MSAVVVLNEATLAEWQRNADQARGRRAEALEEARQYGLKIKAALFLMGAPEGLSEGGEQGTAKP